MEREEEIINQICNGGLLPLFYHDDITVCKNIVQALYNGGVRCIEFTNRGSKAAVNFAAMVREKNNSMPDMFLGIGTIKTKVSFCGDFKLIIGHRVVIHGKPDR